MLVAVGSTVLRRLSPSNPGLYPILAVLVGLVVGLLTPGFFDAQNIRSLLTLASVTGIAAVGLTAITVSGNLFVLSTAAMAEMVAIVYAELIVGGASTPVSLILALLVAMALGLVQGGIVSVGINPIVTTLAVGGVLSGLTPIITNNQILELNSKAATWVGQASVFGISLPIIEFALVTGVVTVLMRRTRGGRKMYLAGASRAASLANGLRPAVTTCIAFVGASLVVGFAGIVQSAQVSLIAPGNLDSLTFDTITAVLVGGAAIQGGKGSPLSTALAAIFVALVDNVVEIRGYSYGVQLTVEGVLVCIAVVGYWLIARGSE